MAAKQINSEKIQSREEMRKKKQEAREQAGSNLKRIRIRLIPIWLRVLLVLIFMAVSLVSGLMVGYGVLGDGNPKDVLKKSTWTHIVDLVNKEK